MKFFLRRGFERSVAGLASMVPTGVASHMLFILAARRDLTDRWGYHIRPIHYYEPLPDWRRISSKDLGRRPYSPALDFRFDAQRSLVRRLGEAYGSEIAEFTRASPQGFDFTNPYFSGLDAATYYALIRDKRPRRVVEIGSGYSTQIAAVALRRNDKEGYPGRLVCIEPFPEPRLTESDAKYELIEKRVQDVPIDFFEEFGLDDILFVDSSHVATVAGDVNYELLDILPRLKPGVWVHVHDIFLPYGYPEEWVIERRLAFNEQYLLEAFLAFNSTYSIQAANAWLWREHQDDARRLFEGPASLAPPASFWMRREG